MTRKAYSISNVTSHVLNQCYNNFLWLITDTTIWMFPRILQSGEATFLFPRGFPRTHSSKPALPHAGPQFFLPLTIYSHCFLVQVWAKYGESRFSLTFLYWLVGIPLRQVQLSLSMYPTSCWRVNVTRLFLHSAVFPMSLNASRFQHCLCCDGTKLGIYYYWQSFWTGDDLSLFLLKQVLDLTGELSAQLLWQ